MIDIAMVYTGLKYWLPLISAFGLVMKGWKSAKAEISKSMDTLLNNHLSHIQTATETTVTETKKTNELLTARHAEAAIVVAKMEAFQKDQTEHNDRSMQVWQGVASTLAILEDRTRRTPRPRRRS